MTAIDSQATVEPLPRWVVRVGMPIAAVVLTLFFTLMRFPYERMGDTISQEIESATGIALVIGDLSPTLGLFGPGIAMSDSRATWGSNNVARIDEFSIRPAWSLSWLTGDPAVVLHLDSPSGQAAGTLSTGSALGWSGEVEALDLSLVPFESLLAGLELEGTASADIDLHRRKSEEPPWLEGSLEFQIAEGAMTLPNLPMGVPFDLLSGELTFGGEQTATIDLFELQGPLLMAELGGTIGLSPRAGEEPLDLSVAIEVKDDSVKTMLRRSGVRLQRDGTAGLTIGGTLSKPTPQ